MKEQDINEIYVKYKEFITNYADLKKVANTIVEQRHLSPVMNDTKWLKLQTAISSTPDFEPAYEVQLLTDDIVRSPIFEKVPTYLGAWELIYENYEFSFHRFLTLSGLLFIPDLHDTEES